MRSFASAFLVGVLVFWTVEVASLDNGLGRTPQMGWNSWNTFGCDVSEDLIKNMTTAMISSGMVDAGYKYMNLDDCVFVGRDSNKRLVPDPQRFPSGIAHLVDYVHSKGLKFGIYTDAGYETCQGRPGLYGYEQIDADTFAGYGVDYLKVDWCHSEGMKAQDRYTMIGKALNATGRPMFYSMCEWGVDKPWLWSGPIANSWRMHGDISANWASICDIINSMEGLSQYAGPGAWNDPDMLEVGHPGLSQKQGQAHFSMWSIMNAPLLAGNDLRNMDKDTLAILTNPEVIAVNQDPLGIAGDIVSKQGILKDLHVWGKKLHDGSYAACLLNMEIIQNKISASFEDFGLPKGQKCVVRDLWERKDMGVFTDSYTVQVPSQSVVMIKITPKAQ